MYSGTLSLLASTYTPPMWSVCSWVMRMASRVYGSTPHRHMRRKISLQERPASTSRLVPELEMTGAGTGDDGAVAFAPARQHRDRHRHKREHNRKRAFAVVTIWLTAVEKAN